MLATVYHRPNSNSSHFRVLETNCVCHITTVRWPSVFIQIEGFAEELDSLSDDFRNVLGEWEGLAREKVEVVGLGTMEDLQQLREETQEMENAVQETTRRMKVTFSCDLMEFHSTVDSIGLCCFFTNCLFSTRSIMFVCLSWIQLFECYKVGKRWSLISPWLVAQQQWLWWWHEALEEIVYVLFR